MRGPGPLPCDDDGRTHLDPVVQVFGLPDVHADASVRGPVADGGIGGRSMDPDARRGQIHGPGAEGAVGTGGGENWLSRPPAVWRRVGPRWVVALVVDIAVAQGRRGG